VTELLKAGWKDRDRQTDRQIDNQSIKQSTDQTNQSIKPIQDNQSNQIMMNWLKPFGSNHSQIF
jgi:hypothetical protein